MKNTNSEVESLVNDFNTIFYDQTYTKWRLKKERAGKDIVGSCYEEFRRKVYTDFGLKLGKNKKVMGSNFNADVVVEIDGVVKIVEECKGHYVDSCFLKRAIGNFAELIMKCYDSKLEVPFFVLSCPTRMRNFESTFNNYIKIYRDDIQKDIISKFKYIPLCKNGRIKKSDYFMNKSNCFDLDQTLVENQITFIKKLTEK